jgi:uncharacterized protein involved in cysteine biosynthesis
MPQRNRILSIIEWLGIVCWPILVLSLLLLMYTKSKVQDEKVLHDLNQALQNYVEVRDIAKRGQTSLDNITANVDAIRKNIDDAKYLLPNTMKNK